LVMVVHLQYLLFLSIFINKIKNIRYHTVGTVTQASRQIVETQKY
jgi:hypothetical protein